MHYIHLTNRWQLIQKLQIHILWSWSRGTCTTIILSWKSLKNQDKIYSFIWNSKKRDYKIWIRSFEKSTQSKPTQTPHRKAGAGSNPGPSRYEPTVLTTKPPCRLVQWNSSADSTYDPSQMMYYLIKIFWISCVGICSSVCARHVIAFICWNYYFKPLVLVLCCPHLLLLIFIYIGVKLWHNYGNVTSSIRLQSWL